MTACPITDDEQTRLDGLVATVSAYQSSRGDVRPRQLLAPQDFIDAGLTPQDLSDAASLGFAGHVDSYLGPDGWGFEFVVTLTRGGATWMRSYQTGPERWRDSDRSDGPAVLDPVSGEMKPTDVWTPRGWVLVAQVTV